MSGYTSGNNAPTLMAQAPNRKGNMSKDPAKHGGGVTAITRPQGSTAYADGCGCPPSATGKVNGRNQKVQVSYPAANTGSNFGYMAEGKSYKK